MGGFSGGGLSLGTLSVAITATVDEALQTLQKFGNEVGTIIDDQKAKWDKLGDVGAKLSGVGTALTLGITAPLVGMAAVSLSAAGDFESSMNKITAVAGTTGGELELMRQQA